MRGPVCSSLFSMICQCMLCIFNILTYVLLNMCYINVICLTNVDDYLPL